MKDHKFYKVRFEDGNTTSYINKQGKKLFGKLKLSNWYFSKEKYMIETKEYDGDSHDEVLEEIKRFLKENSSQNFTLTTE